MGLQYRKSKKLGPVRLTLSKRGVSASVGIPGFRATLGADGRVTTTASIPGTGIRYQTRSGPVGQTQQTPPPPAPVQTQQQKPSKLPLYALLAVGVGLILLSLVKLFFPANEAELTDWWYTLPVGVAAIVGAVLLRRHDRQIEEAEAARLRDEEIRASNARADWERAEARRREAEAAAQAEREELARQGLERSDVLAILLELDERPEQQAALKALSLNIDANGLHDADTELGEEDGRSFFLLNGQSLGAIPEDVAVWLDENADSVDAVTGLRFLGGGIAVDGSPRPFQARVELQLTGELVHPKAAVPALKPEKKIYGVNSGCTCFVSAAGTIHLPFSLSCGVKLDRCEPMVLSDAIAAGHKPCAHCFGA